MGRGCCGLLRRRQVNIDIEKKIITGLIVSSDYCREIFPMLRVEYFQADYSKRIAKWVLAYFTKYKEAPSAHIQDIFLVERERLGEGEITLISTFLDELSAKYAEGGAEETFNVQWLVDRTIVYFKEKALLMTAEAVTNLVGAGKVDQAEKQMQEYRKVAKSISTWIDPFDRPYVEKVFQSKFEENEEDRTDFLFRFPGKLGWMMGGFERGWLISFLGPMKRGKSFFLQELAFQAFINKLNVVFISLEMGAEGLASRIYKRVSALSPAAGDVIYPTFDCEKNQRGTCTKPQRTNRHIIYRADGGREPFRPGMQYKPCTACRARGNESRPSSLPTDVFDFIPAPWFEVVKKDKFSFQKVNKKLTTLTSTYGNRLRIKAYPAYSANLSTVMHDIDHLEYTDGFVPDIIVHDYMDISAPEDSRTEGRDRIDQTWKMAKNIAATRHCLFATASQANRMSMERRDVRQIDVAEDIRKLAHVDAMFSLNQTPWEKRQGFMRIGTMAHRWKDFDQGLQVAVLQQLTDGQVILDSEVVWPGSNAEEVRE
jgi:hypothetical protein